MTGIGFHPSPIAERRPPTPGPSQADRVSPRAAVPGRAEPPGCAIAVSIGAGSLGAVLCPGRGIVQAPPVAPHARDRGGQRGRGSGDDPETGRAQESPDHVTVPFLPTVGRLNQLEDLRPRRRLESRRHSAPAPATSRFSCGTRCRRPVGPNRSTLIIHPASARPGRRPADWRPPSVLERPDRLRVPRRKAQPHRGELAFPDGQHNEVLGRQATARPHWTHQHRLEGAIPAHSETKGAEGQQQFLDRRSQKAAGSRLAVNAKPRCVFPIR